VRKEAVIQVIGTQTYSDGSDDQMDFTTTGTFHRREGAYYIIYRESAITGMEGVTTSLKIEPEKVTLNRMGAADYKQVFEIGIHHRSTYVTPQASFYLGVETKEMEIHLTEHGGHITLKYNLFTEDDLLSQNTLRIIIKEDTPR
jgi:uncharacterized beta-barrel protein YwiB (DUF1934 family)